MRKLLLALDSENTMNKELVVNRSSGNVELRDENGVCIWSSDSDEEFRDLFDDEFIEPEDMEDILGYLITNKHLNQEDASELDIYEETESEAENEDDFPEDGEEVF